MIEQLGEDRCGGCGVGRGLIINMSHGERTGRERRKRAVLLRVCLQVGEMGWHVWAAGPGVCGWERKALPRSQFP